MDTADRLAQRHDRLLMTGDVYELAADRLNTDGDTVDARTALDLPHPDDKEQQ
jgi:hypothetical protein